MLRLLNSRNKETNNENGVGRGIHYIGKHRDSSRRFIFGYSIPLISQKFKAKSKRGDGKEYELFFTRSFLKNFWPGEEEKKVKRVSGTSEWFYDRARKAVYEYVKARLEKTDTHVTFGEDEVYIVWACFILGNWKCLISTTLPDGMYYEVTWNDVADEMYLDAYKKFDNVKVND